MIPPDTQSKERDRRVNYRSPPAGRKQTAERAAASAAGAAAAGHAVIVCRT